VAPGGIPTTLHACAFGGDERDRQILADGIELAEIHNRLVMYFP
jgi:hypothetical protein